MFQAAARKAIASVVFSRIVMASPGMCEFIISWKLRNRLISIPIILLLILNVTESVFSGIMLTNNDSRENNTKEIVHLKEERKVGKNYNLLIVGVCVWRRGGY